MKSDGKQVAVVVTLVLLVYFSAVMTWSVKDPSRNHVEPPVEIVADDSPMLAFNPDVPFVLEFGRGSGWAGLATVKLATSGMTTVIERRIIVHAVRDGKYQPVWAASDFHIKEADAKRIGQSIKELALCDLQKEYRDRGFADGVQWVLCLQQNDRKKAVYFNNYFPRTIRRFSAMLDETLEPYKREEEWKEITVEEAHLAGKSLWDSLK